MLTIQAKCIDKINMLLDTYARPKRIDLNLG